jgi:hypothetical protein
VIFTIHVTAPVNPISSQMMPLNNPDAQMAPAVIARGG